ncbi:MAG: hypothetical protein C5B60_11170, partial [Chloroflexi bacterium]
EKDQFGRVRKVTHEHSTDPDELPPEENKPSKHQTKGEEEEEEAEATSDYRSPFVDAVYDREFSAEQRKKAASEGAAMKGGGFPIRNKEDLANARQALGRAKNRSATIAHIKKRAKALGVDLPEDWPNDSALADRRRRTTMRDPFGRLHATFEEEDSAFTVVGDYAEPEITLYDTVEFDDAAKVRITDDGYLTASPRIARTGIQVYAGTECGRDDLDRVRILRPDSAVFSDAAMHSYAHRPITLDHPSEAVNKDNWRHYAIGHTGEPVVRDGGSVRVPMVLMDAAAIDAFKNGHNQLSVGYKCHLDWTPGLIDGTGEQYDAIQRDIKANHLAVVANARGGSTLKIGDDRRKEFAMNLKSVMIDGIETQVSETAVGLINRLNDKYTKLAQAFDQFKKKKEEEEEEEEEENEENDAALKAKDAQIKVLQKQLADAQSPEAQEKLAQDRFDAISKARAILGSNFSDKGKTVDAIRREVVASRMGDAATKAWSDSEIAAAFTMVEVPGGIRDAVAAFAGQVRPGGPGYGDPQAVKDAAYGDMVKDLSNAWMSPERRAALGK